jgi:hypothetical protein
MDPLYDAIERAIDQPLDGTVFEQCAVELLRDFYPTLQPVEGGGDAGMDGVGTLPTGEPFILVATVSENARGNLNRNIQSYIDAGGERRIVVFATSRKVSGQRRQELEKHLKDEFGVRLAATHARADFIELLYRHPQCRKRLLGVAGMARALTRLPASRRPTIDISLVGRDQDLQQLGDATGDVVLVGKPGIGKTFLLQKLLENGWGLFDANREVSQLEDAIRELRPRRIIIDDAHLNEDRILILRRLRQEIEATFDIVVVTWPGQLEKVAAILPGSTTYEVRELDRGQILEIITEVGVAGPSELQATLVNQALGRAGLAVTLADACISGNVRGAATGHVLLTDIVNWFSRTVGAGARHVLGVLALTGDEGATVAQVGRALGLPTPRVSDLILGLASGGTIDEVPWSGSPARLRVQPEDLRYALVRDVFFEGPGSIDVTEVFAHLDRPTAALLPLVGAAHRGARIDRHLLRGVIDVNDERAVVAYASLGPSETNEALHSAPRHRGAVAREAFELGISPDRALRVLMELAVGDPREENSNPDQPLRIVGDRLKTPRGILEARRLAVTVADQWLQEGGDQEVGLRVLMHAIHPGTSRSYTDPGLGNTVTIAEAALPFGMIRDLAQLWDSILNIIERERPTKLAIVLDALHPWAYPQTLGFGRGPDDSTRRVIRDVATDVISRLSRIAYDRPGVLRRLRQYASDGGLTVTVEVPHEFDVLFPETHDRQSGIEGYHAWERRASEAVRDLAVQFERLTAEEIAERITAADKEASDAHLSYPRLTPQFSQELASKMDNLGLLITELERRAAAADLLLPILDRMVEIQSNGWEDTIERLVDSNEYGWVSIQVSLTRSVGDHLKDVAISRLTIAHSNLIDTLIIRDEVDADTVERLLNAPDPLVARAAAVAVGVEPNGALLRSMSETARRRWRAIIVESPADDHWYPMILERDPQLFADWLRNWLVRLQANSESRERVPHTVEQSIGSLPVELRAQLIQEMPSGIHPILVLDVVVSLVSDDSGVAKALFNREDLKDLHGAALHDSPYGSWIDRALMALDRGWEPSQIVAPVMFRVTGWSGEESAHWQEMIDAFESLGQNAAGLDPQRERIIAAGVEYYRHLRDDAADRERQERIFGR